jgi:two-component system LytT family response regulator
MLQRIAEIGHGAGAAANTAGRAPVQHLLVRDREGAQFLQVADVDWIESAGNYVRIHSGAQTHTVRRSMAELEGLLDARSFIRTHRSHIVNLSRIRRLETTEDGSHRVLLQDGTVLPLSRTYRAALFDSMGTEF